MNLSLSQAEADALLALDKHHCGPNRYAFPIPGGALRIPLRSADGKEEFILDLAHGRIELQKNTLQTRARKTIVLVRLDLGGAPHRNPDDAEIPCPHLHLYREGFADKWAVPLPADFTNPQAITQTLDDFMNYCHIVTKPNIDEGLFI